MKKNIKKASFAVSAAIAALLTASVPAMAAPTFSDVKKEGNAFYDAIYWAADGGITTGFDDGTFRQDADCTRGQAVTFLWRYLGRPAPSSDVEVFQDVNRNSQFYTAIAWATENGVTTGFDDGTFRQDDSCTRGQISAFIWRALKDSDEGTTFASENIKREASQAVEDLEASESAPQETTNDTDLNNEENPQNEGDITVPEDESDDVTDETSSEEIIQQEETADDTESTSEDVASKDGASEDGIESAQTDTESSEEIETDEKTDEIIEEDYSEAVLANVTLADPVPFSDVNEGSIFYDAIQWMVGNGITTGFTDGTFKQDDKCTRGQIVAFLYRIDHPESKIYTPQTPTPTQKPQEPVKAEPVDAKIEAGWYKISAFEAPNLVLDVQGDSDATGTNIQLYTSNNSNAQRFYISPLGNGEYTVMTGSSAGLEAMDIYYGKAENGTNVWQHTYNGSSAQRWRILKNSDGSLRFEGVANGLSLDIAGGQYVNGNNIRTWAKHNNGAEKFAVTKADIDLHGKVYTIKSALNSGFSLDVDDKKLSVNTNIQMWENTNENHRKFRFERAGGGYYKLIPLHSELALGVSGANTVQSLNNDSDAIKWQVVVNGDGTVAFKNKATGKVLNAVNAANGQNVNTVDKISAANQKFTLQSSAYVQDIPNGCYNILTSGNNAVNVYAGKTANGTIVNSMKVDGTTDQMFGIEYLGDGYYRIKTASTIYGSSLDVTGGNFASGTKIQQYANNNASAQKWRILSSYNNVVFMTADKKFVMDVTGGNFTSGRLQLAPYTVANANQLFSIKRANGFLTRNGRHYYFNQNGDKPMIGIDVSAWSENINWDKVKADGIEFAIIRTTHRNGQIDPYGQRNMNECERVGIPFGIYCYTLSTTYAGADYEASVMINSVKGHNPQLGLFVDVEDTSTYTRAFGNIYSASARRNITNIAKRMITRIQEAGYIAGIYGNEDYLNNVLYLNEMPEAKWVAKYFNNSVSASNVINLANKGYKIWQFTDSATVNGLPYKGYGDLNTLLEKYW